jgi:hypothetical protein
MIGNGVIIFFHVDDIAEAIWTKKEPGMVVEPADVGDLKRFLGIHT